MMDNSYFSIVSSLIEDNSKVLDVGCGEGDMLLYLMEHNKIKSRGLELSMDSVKKAVGQGLSVIHGDANNDLDYYQGKSFDYVILSNTLQAMNDVLGVLRSLVRIGKKAIVVIPNFAHYSARFQLFFKGKMPVTKDLPYNWYDTPNIHFCAIKDFEELCKQEKIKIENKVFLNKSGQQIKYNPFINLFTLNGIFVLSSEK